MALRDDDYEPPLEREFPDLWAVDDDTLCVWCGEPLRFGPPWMHRYDGATVRVRFENGRQVDDHVALPDRRER